MIKYFFLMIFNLFLCYSLFSQVNADSLFREAAERAKVKDYKAAISIAEKVHSADTERQDVLVFMANVYAWQKDYDNAKKYIRQAYKKNPSDDELYDSWLNILLWKGENKELLEIINLAEKNDYANSYNLVLKKMLAYRNLGLYPDALKAYKEYNKGELKDSLQINILYRELLFLNRRNTVSVFYSIDFFDNQGMDPQHLAFIDYSMKIKEHRLLLRANYAERFDKNEFQLESDFYQKLTDKSYLYYNYGYSFDNEIFPSHRIGFEYYFPLKEYEASLGGRYLKFKEDEVVIATAHIAKYIRNYWIALRPFYVINNSGNGFASVLNIRRYGKHPFSYWGMELNYGNSPDERFILNNTNYKSRNNSYRIKLEKNISFGNANELKLGVGYGYEEYIKDTYRNRYMLEVTYKF